MNKKYLFALITAICLGGCGSEYLTAAELKFIQKPCKENGGIKGYNVIVDNNNILFCENGARFYIWSNTTGNKLQISGSLSNDE